MNTSRRSLVLAAAVAVALVLAGLVLWLGLTEVPEGQVQVVPAGDDTVAKVLEPGRHWRAPWGAEPLALPRDGERLTAEAELTTPEGASIVLAVDGSFAVSPGGEEEWVAAAGWRPFVEGLQAVAESALADDVRSTPPAEIFEEAAEARYTSTLAAALDAAGLTVEGLAVTAPPEKNPVAAAVIRNRFAALAEPSGSKVLVVGWDGADWLMIRPLLEQGRLPNLKRLIDGGVSGDLRSQEPLLSPLIWTTIATGKPVVEHGIADFLVRDAETGNMVPISSTSRKVHALWTILPAFDLSSDVVAWWATWPAERVQGTMVTDRVAYQLFDYAGSDDPRGKVYPEAAWPRVEEHLVAAEEVPWEQVQRFVDLPAEELQRRWDALPEERRQEDKVNHLRKILATTESYHAIALDLLEEQADLTLVYYEGTDTVGHLFARYLPPQMRVVSAREVAAFGGALPAFYEWADQLLGELIEAAGDDTTVMVISDHGFFTGAMRPESDPADFASGAAQWHRQFGIVVGDGPGIGRAEVTGASIFDVAPTVLAQLGLPVPEDMPGGVIEELLPAAARAAPPQRLASYEPLPRSRPEAIRFSAEDDEDRLRELVALGYISPDTLESRTGGGEGGGDGHDHGERSAAAPPPGGAPGGAPAGGGNGLGAVAGGDQGVVTEAYNLGRIAQREGRLDDAERQYRLALSRMPSFGLGYASLAQVEALRGDHSAAFEWLVQGLSRGTQLPGSAITGLVEEANEAGRLAEAEPVLERLRPKFQARNAYHAAWGLLREHQGNPQQALTHYDRALAIEPLDQLAIEQKMTILRSLGREAEAKQVLTSSFDHARGSVTTMNSLAVAALRQGWSREAETLLREVLESDPGNPGVLANLAASLARQRRMKEASDVMQRAVERDPTNAGNHFNLGAMLAEQGRIAEALASFERAIDLGLRYPRVYVAAAKMHFRLGDRAASRRALEQALQIAPNDPEARQLLSALDQAGS